MTALAYALYLIIAFRLTHWVAQSLSRDGKIYLVRCFGHDEELAASANRLLVLGFYLVSSGAMAVALATAGRISDAQGFIKFLAVYGGGAALMVGLLHFLAMRILARHGRRLAARVRDVEFATVHPQRFADGGQHQLRYAKTSYHE
jgi:hypothetical protein